MPAGKGRGHAVRRRTGSLSGDGCVTAALGDRKAERLEVFAQILVVVEVVLDGRKAHGHVVLFKPFGWPAASTRRWIAFEALRIGQSLPFGAHEPPHVELARVRMRRTVRHDVTLARHARPDLFERHEAPRLVLHHDQSLQIRANQYWELAGHQESLALRIAVGWARIVVFQPLQHVYDFVLAAK